MRPKIAAAGGILTTLDRDPRIAIVLHASRNEWVLPKGKLEPGETALQAARREVQEETGYVPRAFEFLDTLTYERGVAIKTVQFWRMVPVTNHRQEFAAETCAVEWLSLSECIATLSRPHEREFLGRVGPRALGMSRYGRDDVVLSRTVPAACCGLS